MKTNTKLMAMLIVASFLVIGCFVFENSDYSEADNINPVASITTPEGTTTEYDTIIEAMNALNTYGGTITILDNLTNLSNSAMVFSKNTAITLDLAGKTIGSTTDQNPILVQGSQLTVIDSVGGGKILNTKSNNKGMGIAIYENNSNPTSTLEILSGSVFGSGWGIYSWVETKITINGNATVGSNGNDLSSSGIIVANDATITISGNASVKATGMAVQIASGTSPTASSVNLSGNATLSGKYGVNLYKGGTTNVSGNVSITTTSFCISNNGNDGNPDANINISGGSFTSSNAATIYHAGNGKTTITGGTFTGDTGVEIRAGTLEISDGSFTATGIPTVSNANGNGSTTSGAAIAVVQHTTKKAISVSITGGTFNGYTPFYEKNVQGNSESDIDKIRITASGGTFSAINGGTYSVWFIDAPNVSVVGGIYSTNPSQYVPSGYTIQQYQGKYYVGSPVTVSFDTQGGSAVDPQTINYYAVPTIPENPAKDGYTFGGWYTSAEGTEKFDFSAPVSQNITVYAHWSERPVETYTVSFDSNGGSSVSSQTVTKGLTVTRPDSPVKDNARFAGWYTSSELTEKYVFSTPVESNMTLYAKWTDTAKVSIPESDAFIVTDTSGNRIYSQTVNAGTTFQFMVQLSSGYDDLDVFIDSLEDDPIEPTGDVYAVTVNNDTSVIVAVLKGNTSEASEEKYIENDDGSTTEVSTKITVTDRGESAGITISETQSTTNAGETGVTSTVSTEANIDMLGSATVTMIVSGAEEVTVSENVASVISQALATDVSITANVPKVNLPSGLLNEPAVNSITVVVNSDSDNSARITLPRAAIASEDMSENISIEVTSSSARPSPSSIGGSNAIPAFDLTLTGTTTTAFASDVSVSYDVSLPSGAENIRAYCIDTGEFIRASYSNGVASFSVPHFSSWTIVYDEPSVVIVDDDDDILFILEQQKKAREAASAQTTTGDDSEEEVAVIIAAAAVAGAMLACAFFAFRRP